MRSKRSRDIMEFVKNKGIISRKSNQILTNKDDGNKQLMRYAGLAMQFLVSLGIGVFLGLKADGWFHISFPLLVWLLPLLIICGIMYNIVKDTSNRK